MTNIDAVFAMKMRLARHSIFPQLCSDLMLYMAHNSAGYALYAHFAVYALYAQ